MDRQRANLDTDDHAAHQPAGDAHTGMPRWIKAFVAVGLALIVAMRFTGE